MKVELKVSAKVEEVKGAPKRGRPKKQEPIYTPAVIDASRIDFAFIDEDGDINIRFAGTEEYYAIKYSESLFSDICFIVGEKVPKIKGLR